MRSRRVKFMQKPGLEDQIAVVARELAFREHIYPKWVITRKGGMTQNKADFEIAVMREALYTLRKVRALQVVKSE